MLRAARAIGVSGVLWATIGCGGGGTVQGGGGASGGASSAAPPPAWFHARPKSPSNLYFVGDASGAADESAARDLAIQKALAELTVYCGASVKSDFSSSEREANGKSEQVVSLTVDVAGDELTVREAVVKQTQVGKRSDGGYDAYALIEWPRAEYDGVLRMQRDRGKRALDLFLQAQGAWNDNDVAGARAPLREAKATLGPMRSQVPLEHAEYKNSALLFDAISALSERLDHAEKEKRSVFAVAVECQRDGKAATCNASRAGVLRQAVAKTGRKVSAEPVPAAVAANILSSESPALDKSVRSVGYVVAVRYTAELQAVEGPFTFVRCGARGVLFDTATKRIVAAHELTPEKEGHPNYEGAMEKGFSSAEKKMQKWVEEQVAALK